MFKQCIWGKMLLTVAIFVLLSVSNTNAATELVKCSAMQLRPGDFLRIRVTASPQAVVTVKFLDQTRQLYPSGPQQFFDSLVAASYRTAPGIYPLTVVVKNGPELLTQTKDIEVIARKFVEQRIKVAEKMRQETSTDDKIEADARVGEAVRQKAESQHLGVLWEGSFVKPLAGEKTSDFGLIRYVNDIEHGRHSGWDLAAKSGTQVAAMNRGQVVFAGMLYSSGNTVIVYHGLNLYTSYAHLSLIKVKEGEMVTAGQSVGAVGKTGLATGPHLHLTVRVGETPVDPALLVGQKIEWAN